MTIKLEPNESIKAGTYQFTNDILLSNATYSYNETSEPKLRETMVSESGSITITEVSETKGKVWGTFEFKVKSKYLNKDFIITKGEFNGLGIYEVK